jgi:hypothetical protein
MENLYVKDIDGKRKIRYKSTLIINDDVFEGIIKRYSNNRDISDLKISFLLDRIDLMENILIN